MSVLKSELKQMVTHEIGVRVDDALESAMKELSILEGKQAAFQEGAKSVEALMAIVDQDLEAGIFDIPMAAHVKKYVGRCSLALHGLHQQAMNQRIAQTGVVRGMQHTVELLKGIIDAEKAKAVALAAAAVQAPAENPRERTEGTRPENMKELRLAENVPEPEPQPEPAPVQMKQRGGRKPRASNS